MGDGATLPSPSPRKNWRSARWFRAALVGGLFAPVVTATLSRVVRRVEVSGDSMVPTLLPGDRLLVLRQPRRRWRVGQLAAVSDPRRFADAPLLVKRVTAVTPAGLEVRGDNPSASTDSRTFGLVPRARVVGTVVYRYWPQERAGRLR